MRKLVTTAAFISALSVNAQEFSADSITSFSGIMPGRENHFFYFYYTKATPGAKDKTDLYLQSFTREINPHEKIKIPLAKGENVLACNSNGNAFFVVIGNKSAKTITKAIWERNGQIKKKITEQVPSSFFDNQNEVKLLTAMPDAFILITPAESKKHMGYKAQQFDREMNERWNKTYVPEKGDYQIISAEPAMERILVLRKQNESGNIIYSVQSIMSDNGEQLSASEVKNNEVPAVPSAVAKADDLTGIMGPIGSLEKPQGIFLQLLGPGGEVHSNVQLTNDKFIDSLKGYTRSDIVSGNMSLYPEDIKRTGRGLQLVAEMYSLKKAGKDYNLKTGNLLIFEMDHEGNLTGVKTIEIPGKNINLSGGLNWQPANILQQASAKNIFAYRYTPRGRKTIVAYKSHDNNEYTAHFVNLTDLTADGKIMDQSLPIKHLDNPKADPSLINLTTEGTADSFNDMLSGSENNCILYQYNGSKLAIWMEPMPF